MCCRHRFSGIFPAPSSPCPTAPYQCKAVLKADALLRIWDLGKAPFLTGYVPSPCCPAYNRQAPGCIFLWSDWWFPGGMHCSAPSQCKYLLYFSGDVSFCWWPIRLMPPQLRPFQNRPVPEDSGLLRYFYWILNSAVSLSPRRSDPWLRPFPILRYNTYWKRA